MMYKIDKKTLLLRQLMDKSYLNNLLWWIPISSKYAHQVQRHLVALFGIKSGNLSTTRKSVSPQNNPIKYNRDA